MDSPQQDLHLKVSKWTGAHPFRGFCKWTKTCIFVSCCHTWRHVFSVFCMRRVTAPFPRPWSVTTWKMSENHLGSIKQTHKKISGVLMTVRIFASRGHLSDKGNSLPLKKLALRCQKEKKESMSNSFLFSVTVWHHSKLSFLQRLFNCSINIFCFLPSGSHVSASSAATWWWFSVSDTTHCKQHLIPVTEVVWKGCKPTLGCTIVTCHLPA